MTVAPRRVSAISPARGHHQEKGNDVPNDKATLIRAADLGLKLVTFASADPRMTPLELVQLAERLDRTANQICDTAAL